MPGQKDVTELIGHIRKAGFRVSKSGNAKHWKVQTRTGATVTDENGPLIISSSPSEERFWEMTVHRLIKAKVLKSDPRKETRGKKEDDPGAARNGDGGGASRFKGGRRNPLSDPETAARVHEAKVAAIKAKSAAAKEATAEIRAKLEPVIAKLGGWRVTNGNTGVPIAEFAQVVFVWANTRGRVELPKTTRGRGESLPSPITAESDALRAAIHNLKMPGHTLGDMWRPLFSVFVDALWHEAGRSPEKAAEQYREFQRQALGLVEPTSPQAGAPAVAPAPTSAEAQAEKETVSVGPAYSKVPTLALRTAFLLGSSTTTSEADVLVLVEKIAALEMREEA